MKNQKNQEEKLLPSIEDVGELSGIETLHPGGLDLSKRIGEIVDMKDKKVLEVACGRGVFACYYAKNFGAKITGVDLNPDMIKASINRAKTEGVEGTTEFKVADAMALPFQSNSFDVVVSECALGLASDPQKFLNENVRVTKPGGYVAIHLGVWLKDIPDRERRDVEKRLGGKCFTLPDLKSMVDRAGLVEICPEDWSGVEQMSKIRPARKIKKIGDIFTLWEKVRILFRVLKKFGLKGLFYLNESVKKVTPLYYNDTLGYYLIVGRKPKEE